MRAEINLVNPALLPPRPFFQFRSFVITLLIVLLMLALSGVFVKHSSDGFVQVAEQAHARRLAREEQVRLLERNVHQTSPDPVLGARLAQTREALARLRAVERSLQAHDAQRATAATSLRALAASVSEGVWLKQITLGEGRLSLQGYALDPSRVPVYLARLQAQPAFAGQRFSAFELGQQRFGNDEQAPEALVFSLKADAARSAP